MLEVLQAACDFIILIGAVVLAVSRIASFFGKPISIFTKRHEQAETERLKKLLEELIPKYIEEDGDRRFGEFAEEMKQSIKEELQTQFKPIEESNAKQDEMLNAIRLGMMDTLRQRIMAIYSSGEKTRTISRKDKEVIDELYRDYSSLNGNSYISKYYNRICNDWEVIPDSYDTPV